MNFAKTDKTSFRRYLFSQKGPLDALQGPQYAPSNIAAEMNPA